MTAHNRWAKSDQRKNGDQFAINSNNINQALEQYKSMLGSWIELSEETSRFMNCRLKEDLKIADEISQSKNTTDAAHVQANFVSKMFADYSTETQKLFRLMSENGSNGVGTSGKKKPAVRNGKKGTSQD